MDVTDPFSNKFRPPPLTLDRVLEGRPIVAQDSPLLRLPVMILSDIIKYIETDMETLKSLALVNSDCRQLAQSCQFAIVNLDYSIRSYRLFGALIREATERSITKDSVTRQPSIGACIRYLTASSKHSRDESNMIARMRPRAANEGDDEDEDDEDDDEDDDGFDLFHIESSLSIHQWRDLFSNVTSKVGEIYEPSMILVVTRLPHLESFNWTGTPTIDRYLCIGLGASGIRHLKLHGFLESEAVRVELEGTHSWPLLSLDIQVDLSYIDRARSSNSSPFFSSLFQACSSTLRYLKFSHRSIPLLPLLEPVSLSAQFPSLCFLYIERWTLLSRSTLQSFLQSQRLSTLAVNFSDLTTRDCLDQAGNYPELHTFIWTSDHVPAVASLRFLEQNNQLTAFGTQFFQSPALLERVVCILASFANMKALSLIWDGTTIPDSSLRSMASITSLEDLHLSCGCQVGWKHD